MSGRGPVVNNQILGIEDFLAAGCRLERASGRMTIWSLKPGNVPNDR
jgi:hypothetical protein